MRDVLLSPVLQQANLLTASATFHFSNGSYRARGIVADPIEIRKAVPLLSALEDIPSG
jgi:hypothetical protein